VGGGIELVEAGDIEGLASLVDALLGDDERLRALGRAARATVAEHFTWERCAEETLEAYRLALR
jgi:glycosyltransferase involved in cell wall biosynthesis